MCEVLIADHLVTPAALNARYGHLGRTFDQEKDARDFAACHAVAWVHRLRDGLPGQRRVTGWLVVIGDEKFLPVASRDRQNPSVVASMGAK